MQNEELELNGGERERGAAILPTLVKVPAPEQDSPCEHCREDASGALILAQQNQCATSALKVREEAFGVAVRGAQHCSRNIYWKGAS